ncbi:MAG: C40 family peptidase [Bacteroidetes bacterium]|nr:C40 family peptidase [Bacteroidota bacterium]
MAVPWTDFISSHSDMRYIYLISLTLILLSCRRNAPLPGRVENIDCLYADVDPTPRADTVSPDSLVAFAKTLLGKPYSFGCSSPSTGFDCSGFIGYVFGHFGIKVPRSSVDFTNEGTEIALKEARPGDLILFTGTASHIRTVGHIGMIVANDSTGIRFIHSSSGREEAVIITLLNDRYMERFVKVIRILEDNDSDK